MKKYLLYPLTLTIIFFCCTVPVKAQQSINNFSVNTEYSKSFIENKGQFPYAMNSDIIKNNVLYAVDNGPVKIYFTKSGIVYHLIKGKPKNKIGESKENESTNEEWEESDNKGGKRREYIQDEVSFTWENSNTDVEVVAEDAIPTYFSYTFKQGDSYKNENYIKGYKKVTYKNLYPNIDVEYTFHETVGIKYTLILHPGADVSKISMKYSDTPTLTENGDLHFSTVFGDIVDHAPNSFYTENTSEKITSKFVVTGNSVGFSLASYDNSKSVTIDPWVVTASFSTSTAVWEVETDGSGNVYVIGGETPMWLQKYPSSGGTATWTYVTPWDTASVWLGTLATDDAGNSFITSGTTPEIERINPTGGMVWHSTGGSFISGDDEWWSITFNCDKTKLIVGGTKLFMASMTAYATIFDIDINNGNVLNYQYLDSANIAGFGTFPIEVRSISSSKNAQYIFLTHKDVGAINQNIGSCPTDLPVFQVDNGNNLSYKCENYLPATQNGGGLKALVANDQFFYTHCGNQIQKRSLSDGSLLNTAAIPGGGNTTDIFGSHVIENSGLAVDASGNVYAGSNGYVIKYDANLNILSQPTVTYTVYDVSVNSNGEVIAVGAQQDNAATNRNGRIESLNLSAGGQYALVCCDANICTVDTVCSTDAPFNLTTTTSGGSFTGTGITNASAGTFDPSVAGPGTWTITYTQSCGSGTTEIFVRNCATLTLCQETNGDITVTGGSGPYTWAEYIAPTTTPITNQTECEACGGTWTPFVNLCTVGGMPTTDCNAPATWSNFGTGTTVTPPVGADTIRVTDASLNSTVSYDINSLPNCSSCSMTSSITASTQPSCSANNGTATVTPSGGATPYTYSWNTSPAQTTQTATGLAAGTYTVTVTDAASCTSSATVTLTSPNAPSASITGSTQPSCGASDGTATVTASGGTSPYTYNWNSSPAQTTQTATGLPAGTYTVTVTDNASCTSSATVTLTNPNAPTISITPTSSTCGQSNGSAIANPSGGTGPYTYNWSTSPAQTTQTATGLAAGTYTVTVTDALNCTGVQTTTITDNSIAITVSFSGTTSPSCGMSDGSTTANPSGGTGPYTYSWSTSPAQTTQTATGLPAGTYTVTVTDASSCTGTNSVTLSNPNAPTVSISTTDATCGQNNGSAVATPSGGTSPYTYTWSTSPAQTTQQASNLLPGTYTVTVTDALNCTGVQTCTIADNTTFSADAGASQSICQGDSTTLTATGGTTYAWNTGASTATINVTPTTTTTYTVTVSDAGCTATDTVTVTVNTLPVPAITGDTLICFGTSTTLAATGGATYLWSTSETTSTISVTPVTQTTYNVTVSNSGCTATADITVNISTPPTANAGNDTTINIGNSAQLQGSGGISFSWSPTSTLSCSNCDDPTASPLTTTTYVLVVTDASGCTDLDSVIVTVDMECGEVFVPNAFSPNSDGQNEFECVYGNCIQTIEFAIFDRWGEKVFYTEDPKECWDGRYKGKDLNTGVFVYYMKATLYDGSEKKLQGNLNLFR